MRRTPLLALVLALWACDRPGQTPEARVAPPPPPTAQQGAVVGEYADGPDTVSVLERDGDLWLYAWGGATSRLAPDAGSLFMLEDPEAGEEATPVRFVPRDGSATEMMVGDRLLARIALGGEDGGTFRITPLRPVSELQADALAASPPQESGDFLPSDLVELTTLEPEIRLDIRYASTNNFMGEAFYAEPRAFLQRPAAEALVRAHRWLAQRGYGLLVHDGYRPWYVTRMFWDATPEELRTFVADPSQGSRHNRGCAVDLTLYDLATGEVVEMPGGYDEFSPRSYPDYPGGTTRQRWHRELLREAMEAQGFTVYEAEWWHFDHQDWRRYELGNQRFEEITGA